MMSYAPIIVFAYNRPDHLRRTIDALAKNEMANESILYVYCDGPKDNASLDTIELINQTRAVAHSIEGFKEIVVIEQPHNKGLDPSEIDAITEVINRHGRMISVEDDLITNKFFLRFMNDALDFYEGDKRIYQIAGFVDAIDFPQTYPNNIFASYRTESCGWATWKDRWDNAVWNEKDYDIVMHPSKSKIHRFNRGGDDFYPMLLAKLNGQTDAWDIRWAYAMFLHDGLVIRPTKSLLYNIGFDGTGVHSGNVSQEKVLSRTATLYDSEWYDLNLLHNIKVEKSVQRAILRYFHIPVDPWWVSLKKQIKRFFG